MLLDTQKVDPSVNDNKAIKDAADRGYIEVMKLLLADKRVDPAIDDNLILKWAVEDREVEVVRLLLQDHRVDASGIESMHPEIKEMLAQWKYHPRV